MTKEMTKLLCFFVGLNCLVSGWILTGMLLWWVCVGMEFDE